MAEKKKIIDQEAVENKKAFIQNAQIPIFEEWVEKEDEIFDESKFKYYKEEEIERVLTLKEKKEELLKREMLGLQGSEVLEDGDYDINFVNENTVFLGKREYPEDSEHVEGVVKSS